MYKEAVRVWFDYYKLSTGHEYVFDGKDGRHLKLLLKKIETKVKQKGIEPTEETLLNSLRGFLSSLKDEWILDNLEIALVNSKFNSLYAKAIKSSPFGRRQQIDDELSRKYGAGS